MTDALLFGNYPGSACDSIPTGYSICRFSFDYDVENSDFVFCLSKNPTIGAPNYTSGCCATMSGIMFDKNDNKITNGTFTLDYPITFNEDGTYSTRILAQKCILSNLFQGDGMGGWSVLTTDTLGIDAYPDSVIKRDIHFTTLMDVKQNPVPSNPDLYIINYPNPFNPGTNFFIKMPDNLKREHGRIDIYNSIGQKVYVVPVSNNSSYKWDGVDMSGRAVASGVYYYLLLFKNAVYKTGSMILLK
ncbi:MAG: gliding motility-associated C-terminal domain-containing protein [Candidatus Kryptoniota bacterium]